LPNPVSIDYCWQLAQSWLIGNADLSWGGIFFYQPPQFSTAILIVQDGCEKMSCLVIPASSVLQEVQLLYSSGPHFLICEHSIILDRVSSSDISWDAVLHTNSFLLQHSTSMLRITKVAAWCRKLSRAKCRAGALLTFWSHM
jgi:hypothetical protein